MAAFEFGNRAHLGIGDYADDDVKAPAETAIADLGKPHPPIKDECVIAFKVYDQFRLQDCLTEDEIGPARAAENTCIGDKQYSEGEVIEPPSNAASVTVERLRVKKVIVVEKTPNSFKSGYWDIDLKFVFEYRLTFREADGGSIGSIKANSIINKKVSMFGSINSDIVIGTDFFTHQGGETALIEAAPFILVEAKGVALSAEIKYHRRRGAGDESCSTPCRVDVTIGLFCIVKLFRIVDLNVQSRGFCIPPECVEPCPVNACDFFENLDFPMDIFAPPQKREFKDGVSTNIIKPTIEKVKSCEC
jgi:hypothetical protein